jgi:hypothetical protein
VRADDDGNFAQIGWGTFDFCGQSVYRLRGEVSIQLAEPFASIGMTLCVRAGLCGRLTPLVTDLPRSEEPMDVVILTTGSPGDNLLYIQHSSSHLILTVACSGLVICSSSSDCESMFSPLVGF